MFKSAKIKLTAWYLGILMFVSLSFSTVMYTGVSAITKRALDNQRIRIEHRIQDFEFGRPVPRVTMFIDEGALIEVRERTLGILAVINIIIFFVAGGLGYILAGQTLKPIEVMLNKQRRFITDAAHELKTPITAMKTDIEVTIRDKKPSLEMYKESLKNAVEELDHLNIFVNNLLQKSRYDLGNHQQKVEIIDVSLLIQETIKLIEPLAREKEIALSTEIDNIFVEARPNEIKELVMNLIDNAIKYTNNKGYVGVNITALNNNFVLSVKDNGIGIAQNEIENIFEPFYKTDKSRTNSSVSGYGLGLAIVKDIVNAYKGTINVHSELGKGTTITVNLPIRVDAPQVSLS